MVDSEMATMINMHHADQLIEEYHSDREGASANPLQEVAQENVILGEEPCQRVLQETDVYRTSDNQMGKQWIYDRDPYNRWHLSVMSTEESAMNIFEHIRQSIHLKAIPDEIKEGDIASLGDLELQVPFSITRKTADERFRKTWGDPILIDYLYTINSWEGESDGNNCKLTYYAICSDRESLSNAPYSQSLLDDYYAELYYTEQLPRDEITWTADETDVVREGRYPKTLYKSFGTMNADNRLVRTWWYTENPYDMWKLEIIATPEQADEIFNRVERSIKEKKEYR